MLKKRIIAVLLLESGVLHRTKHFVPDYHYTLNQVNTDHCDELCCLRIGGSWEDFFEAVNHVDDMLPLSVGGGIESLDDVERCFQSCPCDKIVIESNLEKLAGPFCERFGKQSLVAGVTEGRSTPYIYGAGEVFVQSVERDGSLRGYPLDYCKQFLDLGVPVVIGSGCEGYRSMLEAFETGVDAVSTSNIHHFTPTTMAGIKSQLVKRGVQLREKMPEVSDAGFPSEDETRRGNL